MNETVFGIVVVWIILFISFYHLLIAILGLFPNFKATAKGTLQKKHTQRNIRVKNGTIPVLTHYTYSYIVNGKEYRYHSSGRFTKGHLYKNVTMVYVKWFPRHAYPEKFTATMQWIWGLGLLLIGLLLMIAIASVS